MSEKDELYKTLESVWWQFYIISCDVPAAEYAMDRLMEEYPILKNISLEV